MKVRSDFVSNSSSCSFIIHIKTEEDAKHLRDVYDTLLKDKYMRVCSTTEAAMEGCYSSDAFDVYSPDWIEPHSFLFVSNGDDSDIECYLKLEDFAEALNEGYGKLKFYRDYGEHVTLGDDLTMEIEP